jgi:hypothetical protein
MISQCIKSPSVIIISILIDNLTWRPWWHWPQSILTICTCTRTIRSPRMTMILVAVHISRQPWYWWWGPTEVTTCAASTSTNWWKATNCAWTQSQVAILTTTISIIETPHPPFTTPTHTPNPPLITPLTGRSLHLIPIRLLQMQINLFNDEFALLVFLTWFVCLGIGPTYESLASFAWDVTYGVQASD